MYRTATVFLTAFLAWIALGVPLPAYVLTGPKWGMNPVPYYVNPSNMDVSSSAALAAVQAGASAWALQSNSGTTLYYMGTTGGNTVQNNGKNEVFFRNETGGGPAATYWWGDSTGKFVDADIVFYDASVRFFTGTTGCSGGIYIEDVATHEFGHVLGLSHSGVTTATMYPSTSYCSQNWRTLDPDDIAGIAKLYPSSASKTTSVPAAPANLVAAGTTTPSVGLRWADQSSNEDGFSVQRAANGGSFAEIARLAANSTAFTDGAVSAGVSYSYRVAAFNTAGSAMSNTASVTLSGSTTSTTVPAAPASPNPANGATGVAVDIDPAWIASARAARYDVYFGTSSTPPLYATNQTTTTLVLPRLANATSYYWRVVAKNSVGSTSGSLWSFQTKTRGKKR